MNIRRIIGIVVLAAGIFALAYGGFTYTEDRHDLNLGPIELEMKEKETIAVPPWVGAAAAVLGIVMIAYPSKGRA